MKSVDQSADRFPNATESVRELLAVGSEPDAAALVMSLYGGALAIYFLGSSFRRSLPSDESAESVVNDFFAEKVGRPGFLSSWLGRGCKFRHWLLVAFANHLRHRIRRERSEQRRREIVAGRDAACPGRMPRDVVRDRFDAEFARSAAREVMRVGQESCERAGRGDDWRTFTEHVIDGRTYGELADRDGLTQRQVANRVRFAGSRLQLAVRRVLSVTGTPEAELSREVDRWLEALERCRT
ncbi:MAG TPA: hypothetical protein PKC43_01265 [Phycisphaerales bacterium]|nr:hypothetical protein [Phycisphaerales bacterium]HMP36054.1 hypothetical protein [Phycisphaerales bacterium]